MGVVANNDTHVFLQGNEATTDSAVSQSIINSSYYDASILPSGEQQPLSLLSIYSGKQEDNHHLSD